MSSPVRFENSSGRRLKPIEFAGKGIATFGAISMLLILFVSETSLQKVMVVHRWYAQRQHRSGPVSADGHCRCPDPPRLDMCSSNLKSSSNQSSGISLLSRPTVHEAFEGVVTHFANLTLKKDGQRFQTVFEENRNIGQYGLTGVRNVCMRPDGRIVIVGLSAKKIFAEISKVPKLHEEWMDIYECSGHGNHDCVGVEEMAADKVPAEVRWVAGTTTHIIPHLENVFHNFADRLWPHIVGFQYPLNETSPHPIDHFLVHRFSTWLFQAGHNMDRNTFMYQIRLLGKMAPGADFLVADPDHLKEEDILFCFERLVLACTTCDRISNILGSNITKPALLRYRDTALSHFGIMEPAIPLPPNPMRVAFYGRRDTRRRRVANCREVVEHLRNYKHPPLDVTDIDELMADGRYNQSLPEVVSLFSQTDILITVHGANTWAALFMPRHAAVIEIEGPCGPYTWLETIANALDLKHDTSSNPWGKRVPSKIAGNTTECEGFFETPDFTLDIDKLDEAIHGVALPTYGFQDTITLHWLHDWLAV